MIAFAEILLRQGRERIILEWIQHVQQVESSISPILYRNALCFFGEQELVLQPGVYVTNNREYNEQQLQIACQMIADLHGGSLKHHSIHCVSFRECMSTVIGLDIHGFGRLMTALRDPLSVAFPRSPETLEYGQTHVFCERRFKLFLCLFRLKQGATFSQMELVFGWSTSVLQEWFEVVLHILVIHLRNYHTGFLTFKGAEWQAKEVRNWRYKHVLDGSIDTYTTKVAFQNSESVRNGMGPTINAQAFVGSIGAIDGTYSVQPQLGKKTLEAHGADPSLDLMYSEYKHCHAYKLLLFMSHGLQGEPKYLLWVESGCGAAADSGVLASIAGTLDALLIPEAAFLGDHAFHSANRCIAPYTTSQVNAAPGANRAAFNTNHSSDRMTSEHGVRALKIWGVVRGRDDSFLFLNDENYKRALKVVWGLHNYIASGCPAVLP